MYKKELFIVGPSCNMIFGDHTMYVPSQWATALQFNAISHLLGAYTERSPGYCIKRVK